MTTIDWTRPVQFRSGEKVTVLTHTRPTPHYPVLLMLHDGDLLAVDINGNLPGKLHFLCNVPETASPLCLPTGVETAATKLLLESRHDCN